MNGISWMACYDALPFKFLIRRINKRCPVSAHHSGDVIRSKCL
jgi:hypothetical protein